MKKYLFILSLCALTLFSCEKDEAEAFVIVDTVLPDHKLAPLVIHLNKAAETSRIRPADIVVTRGWMAEEVGITYTFGNNNRELHIFSADTQDGWSPEQGYTYSITLYHVGGEKLSASGSFTTGDKLKGSIQSLVVSYDIARFCLAWEKLPNAEVYDIYAKEKDRGDYVLLTSVMDDGREESPKQTFSLYHFLEENSRPQGVYYIKMIGRNVLTKGNLAAAIETEVATNVFPPVTGLKYDSLYTLSWNEPPITAYYYSLYAMKEGATEYSYVTDIRSPQMTAGKVSIDIIEGFVNLGLDYGTYQIKIVGNTWPGNSIIGDVEQAEVVEIEYHEVVLPPLLLLSVEGPKITWGTGGVNWTLIEFYVKNAEEADSEYKLYGATEAESTPSTTIVIYANRALSHNYYLPPQPAGTYIFKTIFADYRHRWFGSLDEAVPVVYEYDGIVVPPYY